MTNVVFIEKRSPESFLVWHLVYKSNLWYVLFQSYLPQTRALAGVPWPGPAGGGTPIPGWRGIPPSSLGQGQGTPSSLGAPPPSKAGWGYPPSRDGVPPCQEMGIPPPPSGPAIGYPPPLGQQKEYLICRGRYASCLHAGGLSCFEFKVNYKSYLLF